MHIHTHTHALAGYIETFGYTKQTSFSMCETQLREECGQIGRTQTTHTYLLLLVETSKGLSSRSKKHTYIHINKIPRI